MMPGGRLICAVDGSNCVTGHGAFRMPILRRMQWHTDSSSAAMGQFEHSQGRLFGIGAIDDGTEVEIVDISGQPVALVVDRT